MNCETVTGLLTRERLREELEYLLSWSATLGLERVEVELELTRFSGRIGI